MTDYPGFNNPGFSVHKRFKKAHLIPLIKIMPKEMARSIKPVLTVFKNQIEKIDNKLLQLIEDCDDYKTKNDIIQSMPGVGNVVAISLLSNMPESGLLTNKQAASLMGIAPVN